MPPPPFSFLSLLHPPHPYKPALVPSFGGGGLGTHEGVSLAARHPQGEVDSGQKLGEHGLRPPSSHYPVCLLRSGLWRKEHRPQANLRSCECGWRPGIGVCGCLEYRLYVPWGPASSPGASFTVPL